MTPPAKRKSTEEAIIRQVLSGEAITSIVPILDGRDGDKFLITTSKKENFFCKIRKNKGATLELPYQEIEILGSVNSPNVVRPIKADKIKERYVLITPYIEGENLEEHLRKQGPLSEVEAKKLARILFEIASEMDLAGAIHFDIKPANIIVGNDREYYLVDFGAARYTKKMRTEKIFPARSYIAPEVLRHLFYRDAKTIQQISILADMYGIGAVLYHAVTGTNFGQEFHSAQDVLQLVPNPVRKQNGHLDPKFAALIDRLISKEPSGRPLPADAIGILNGAEISPRPFPSYFLKTKPGGEHLQMIDIITANPSGTGIYWASDSAPFYERRTPVSSILWEMSPATDENELEKKLLAQYKYGVTTLCVPSIELENPLNSSSLQFNLQQLDYAIKWKNELGLTVPILAVVAIDEALLNSAEITIIKNAYASKAIDGLILRVCVPTNQFSLDARHLRSIKELLEAPVAAKKIILFDGDLSIIPLSLYGVTGLVSTTFPRLQILKTRMTPVLFAKKPDGMFVPALLSIIGADAVASLRGSTTGKAITNCPCSACESTLMRPGNPSWLRPERRKHFILTFPGFLEHIKKNTVAELVRRVNIAQREKTRFSFVRMDLSRLKHWLEFLQRP